MEALSEVQTCPLVNLRWRAQFFSINCELSVGRYRLSSWPTESLRWTRAGRIIAQAITFQPTESSHITGAQLRQWLRRGDFAVAGWRYTPSEWFSEFSGRYGVTSEERVQQICAELITIDRQGVGLPWPWQAEQMEDNWEVFC